MYTAGTKMAWRKSSYSSFQGGECVEVGSSDYLLGVRDSKNPDGPVLTLSPSEWRDFLSGIRAGEFD